MVFALEVLYPQLACDDVRTSMPLLYTSDGVRSRRTLYTTGMAMMFAPDKIYAALHIPKRKP